MATSSGDSHTWRKNAKLSRQDAKSGRQNETPERGGIPHFSNNSTMEQYFKMLLSHEGVYSFSSPYCSGKLCSSPFYVPGEGNGALYSEAEPIKGA